MTFNYPEEVSPQDMVNRIAWVLKGAEANQDVWQDQRMDWANFIQRESWKKGVNPAWVLVSLQRERSLLGQKGEDHDFDFAQGVVGQDSPGSVNERWNGLPTQIMLSVECAAWLGGIGLSSNFGYRPGLWPTQPRWPYGKVVKLYDSDHKPIGFHNCLSLEEYVQLSFTPHLEVIGINANIYERWVKPFFG